MKFLALVFGFIFLQQIALGEPRCAGGGEGGGVPFGLIPKNIAEQPNWIKTKSMVQGFLFWETTNRVLYHDGMSWVRAHDLANGLEYGVSELGIIPPFSPVKDPDNRYFSTVNFSSLFDSKNHTFIKMPMNVPQQELFWHEGVLYTQALGETAPGSMTGSIHAYKAKSKKVTTCFYNLNGEKLSFANNNEYPYAYGFTQKELPDGTFDITTYKVDVRKELFGSGCSIEIVQKYKDPFPGRVSKMHRYNKIDGNIFELEHKTKNLLWDKGVDECIFYDLGRIRYSVLNGDSPSVATWDQEDGLGLIYPRLKKRTQIEGFGHMGLSASDIAITKNGDRLYFAQRPEENEEKLKLLYRVDLNGVKE